MAQVPPKPRPKRSYIWDGKAFRDVPADEAARLVAEDKAQDLTARRVEGTRLKRRNQFTGYQTAPGTKPALDPEPLKGWASYRGVVAKALDKPVNRVTKADVEAWQADGSPQPDPLA